MTEEQQGGTINKDLVIEELLENNKSLTRELAFQKAANATNIGVINQLTEHSTKLEETVAQQQKQLEKYAGPVPVKDENPVIIDAETENA